VEDEGVFQGCASSKNVKGSFPSCSIIFEDILQLVYSDLCGPMSMTSLGGYLYYVTFVDDLSPKKWIFFLKENRVVVTTPSKIFLHLNFGAP